MSYCKKCGVSTFGNICGRCLQGLPPKVRPCPKDVDEAAYFYHLREMVRHLDNIKRPIHGSRKDYDVQFQAQEAAFQDIYTAVREMMDRKEKQRS